MNEVKIITHELLKSWDPCQDGYERFCELFPNGADLQTAIDGLTKDQHDDWAYWLFNRCQERKLFTEISSHGYRNSGNRNSGDYNSGDYNSGYFNTQTPDEILIFNKPCKRSVWENSYKPNFLYFNLIYWVDESEMTDADKAADPNFYFRGGQLKKRDYKEAFKLSWDNADKEDRIKVKELPNFDAKLFFEISGIDVDKEQAE